MIAVIIYLFIGLITGFITYWISYRMSKEFLVKNHDEKTWHPKPTHELVKKKVIEEDVTPIILSILFWPVALLVIYPIIALFIGSCVIFNWMIDKIEGGKYGSTTKS